MNTFIYGFNFLLERLIKAYKYTKREEKGESPVKIDIKDGPINFGGLSKARGHAWLMICQILRKYFKAGSKTRVVAFVYSDQLQVISRINGTPYQPRNTLEAYWGGEAVKYRRFDYEIEPVQWISLDGVRNETTKQATSVREYQAYVNSKYKRLPNGVKIAVNQAAAGADKVTTLLGQRVLKMDYLSSGIWSTFAINNLSTGWVALNLNKIQRSVNWTPREPNPRGYTSDGGIGKIRADCFVIAEARSMLLTIGAVVGMNDPEGKDQKTSFAEIFDQRGTYPLELLGSSLAVTEIPLAKEEYKTANLCVMALDYERSIKAMGFAKYAKAGASSVLMTILRYVKCIGLVFEGVMTHANLGSLLLFQLANAQTKLNQLLMTKHRKRIELILNEVLQTEIMEKFGDAISETSTFVHKIKSGILPTPVEVFRAVCGDIEGLMDRKLVDNMRVPQIVITALDVDDDMKTRERVSAVELDFDDDTIDYKDQLSAFKQLLETELYGKKQKAKFSKGKVPTFIVTVNKPGALSHEYKKGQGKGMRAYKKLIVSSAMKVISKGKTKKETLSILENAEVVPLHEFAKLKVKIRLAEKFIHKVVRIVTGKQ
jgi:hypothetical protein